MVPTIGDGCTILVETFDGSHQSPRINDICLYWYSVASPNVCHRVVAVDEARRQVVFEGDGNTGRDGGGFWIPMDRIRWRVVSIIYTERP